MSFHTYVRSESSPHLGTAVSAHWALRPSKPVTSVHTPLNTPHQLQLPDIWLFASPRFSSPPFPSPFLLPSTSPFSLPTLLSLQEDFLKEQKRILSQCHEERRHLALERAQLQVAQKRASEKEREELHKNVQVRHTNRRTNIQVRTYPLRTPLPLPITPLHCGRSCYLK